MKSIQIDEFIAQTGGYLDIAVDTEFEGPHTLTIQFAVSLGSKLVVQVYRSPAIPDQPKQSSTVNRLRKQFKKWRQGIVVRPTKLITPELSPVQVLIDLLALEDAEAVSRQKRSEQPNEPLADTLTITLVAHFWSADFLRIFGQRFFNDLLLPRHQEDTRILVQSIKQLGYRQLGPGTQPYVPPVLEYLHCDEAIHPIRVKTFDTSLAFGKGNLDSHAVTFLGIKKVPSISTADKAGMVQTFNERPEASYRYAISDALITLLVHEKMVEADRMMYDALGFTEDEIPALRSTQGGRVAETLTQSIAKSAVGSVTLSRTGRRRQDGSIREISLAKIKKLMSKGSGKFLAEERLSRFGSQIGETHGGLLFTRSPTKFFHGAPGQLRDVDLSSCYSAIIGQMKMYIGLPYVHEPGSQQMTLKEAVALVHEHAAGQDAWIIKVSGQLTTGLNALIPSTNGAITNANFQNRRAKQRAKARRHGFAHDWLYQSRKETGNSTLYTSVIEAGMVAWSTWLLIQTLPKQLREAYEKLEVETILIYPDRLVARSGSELDTLQERFASAQTPWTAHLDMKGLKQTTEERLDADYVSLEFDIGALARKFAEFRQEAKVKHGKKSGAELAWKQHANTLYGLCASPYYVTNNVVTANVITATARVLAYLMQMSLNGIQVITDGCTYRRDQLPAGTFAECLRRTADYPIQRVEDKVPFLDPENVPADDAGFTTWYRQHVKRFFGMQGPAYDQLLAIHQLEHKPLSETGDTAFDGLCCDGSGSYMKLLKNPDGWQHAEFKARSFNKQAKEELAPWLLQTYVADRYTAPPPVSEMTSLLSFQEATRAARQTLDQLVDPRSAKAKQKAPLQVLLPLGFEVKKASIYKIIKPSSFLFRNPEQRERLLKAMQEFGDKYGCGLELLALRRKSRERRQGSIEDIAQLLFNYIGKGGDNLTKDFNLNRECSEFESILENYTQDLKDHKEQLREASFRAIDTRRLDDNAKRTGLLVTAEGLSRIE